MFPNKLAHYSYIENKPEIDTNDKIKVTFFDKEY